jgi:hypothetical protein
MAVFFLLFLSELQDLDIEDETVIPQPVEVSCTKRILLPYI